MLRRFIYLGLEDGENGQDVFKTRAINTIGLITLLFNSVYATFNVFHEQWLAVIMNILFWTTALLTLYFNARFEHNRAYLTTAIGYPLGLFAVSIIIGDGTNCEYFFLISASATPILYNSKRIKLLIFFLNFLLLVGVEICYLYIPEGLTTIPFPPYFAYVNDVIISIVLFAIVTSTFEYTSAYQTLLLQQNKTIQRLNASLEQKVKERTAEIQAKAEALALSNEEIRRLTYITSHDLREPLRNIAGFSKLIQRSIKKKAYGNLEEYTNYINWSVQRMDRLTNDIEVYAQINNTKFESTKIDLNRLVADVLKELEQLIQLHQPQITQDRLPTLKGNEPQIFLLFYHLLENALQYAQVQPLKIEIKAERKTNYWYFEIRDNGVGIEPSYHKHIFKMFKRLHNDLTKESSGIGLALCRKIVHNHQGQIGLTSAKNKGTTFKFTLKDL